MTVLPRTARRPQPSPRSARVEEIAAAARVLLEADGADALTMRRLAGIVGIKAPSLYKHLPSRDALVQLLVEDALFDIGGRMHDALDTVGRRDPVRVVLGGYRAHAVAHPHLYHLVTGPAMPRAGLPSGLEDWAGEPFFRAVGDAHLAQAMWAWAHGMVVLEIDERFLPGSDLDRTWRVGAKAFASGR